MDGDSDMMDRRSRPRKRAKNSSLDSAWAAVGEPPGKPLEETAQYVRLTIGRYAARVGDGRGKNEVSYCVKSNSWPQRKA